MVCLPAQMTRLYLFAHFDDEYLAWPLIRARALQGEDQVFLYAADYADPEEARRRQAETAAFLRQAGVTHARIIHTGAGTGAVDGRVHRHLPAAYAAVEKVARRMGRISRVTVCAWEGGHMDHDCCAAMAVKLAETLNIPSLQQVSLYNAKGLPPPFQHGAAPLSENGPVIQLKLKPRDWFSWMGAVRFFPSQANVWAGLWPAMFFNLARRGFGYQRLEPARVRERPHRGGLYYERCFRVPYAEVRAAVDAFLTAAPAPAARRTAPTA
jgi:LmbE family N-acetylglucosaminyl deacetylase